MRKLRNFETLDPLIHKYLPTIDNDLFQILLQSFYIFFLDLPPPHRIVTSL